MASPFLRMFWLMLVAGGLPLAAVEQTDFTFQGRLTDATRSATGLYDFRFQLWNAPLEGSALGTNDLPAVNVAEGIYSVRLDFGIGVFDGSPRWLEIAVRTNGAAAFTVLQPRLAITPVPYALRAGSVPTIEYDPRKLTNFARLDAAAEFTAGVTASTFTGNGAGLTNIPARAVKGIFSVLNVRDFGAVGDGVADDTAAIQAALDAATQAGQPGDVFFPAGGYKITSTLRVVPNDTHWNLMAQWGPVRLVGNGSAASVLLSAVTDGPAIDARSQGPDDYGLVGLKLERLGLIGPMTDDWNTNDASQGLVLGWANEGLFQYAGHEIMLQDCDISGFTKAIGATNVWGFTADNCTFHSNRLHALAFNCTHSVNLRNVSVYGAAAPGRLTDIAIGFFAPVEAPGWWGFGDTAEMHQTQVQWARVAVYNDELHLRDSGGNYQFVDLGHQLRSNWRSRNGSNEMWRAWAILDGCIYCDCSLPWVTNSPAMVEMDSYIAPNVTFLTIIGDVCQHTRPRVNIIGATVDGYGNGGEIHYGTEHLDVPTLLGGAVDWAALHNGTNPVTLYRWGGSSNTVRGPLTVVGGPLVGDGSGLTNLPSLFRGLSVSADPVVPPPVSESGEVAATGGFVSHRTVPWPASALGTSGFGFWNSNGTIYCTVLVGGVLTNKPVTP